MALTTGSWRLTSPIVRHVGVIRFLLKVLDQCIVRSPVERMMGRRNWTCGMLNDKERPIPPVRRRRLLRFRPGDQCLGRWRILGGGEWADLRHCTSLHSAIITERKNRNLLKSWCTDICMRDRWLRYAGPRTLSLTTTQTLLLLELTLIILMGCIGKSGGGVPRIVQRSDTQSSS